MTVRATIKLSYSYLTITGGGLEPGGRPVVVISCGLFFYIYA